MDKDQIKQILAADPGNPAFVGYAQALIESGLFDSALRVLLAGLSANPSMHKGRLLLAKTFYQLGFRPFAVRELEELHSSLPDNISISKLLDKFGRGVTDSNSLQTQKNLNESAASGSISEVSAPIAANSDDTVAEVEFDVDDIDLVEDTDKDN